MGDGDVDTRQLIDPELLPLLDAFPMLDLSPQRLNGTRALFRQLLTVLDDGPPATRELRVPGPVGAPELRLLVFQPFGPTRRRPTIYFIHGGGMVLGSADQLKAPLWRLANDLDAVVVSVDYRRAPEAPFPKPLEDCYAGLQWLASAGGTIGVDADRIVVMGESAGGGLAASLCLLCRDRGGPRVRGQCLIYPMLDHRTGTPDDPHPNALAGQWLWTRQHNQIGWRALRGSYDLADAHTGYFSPSRAFRLGGLPPTFISVGSLDLFVDESLAFAHRLVRAGVPLESHVYPGAPHAFDLMVNARVARAALDARTRALSRMLA